MSVTAEEKMKLMLELGMENAAVKWAEANSLTTMRFHPINSQKIEELLQVEYQEISEFNGEPVLWMSLLGTVFGVFSLLTAFSSNHPVLGIAITLSCVGVGIALGYWMGLPKMETHVADVCQMPLHEWEDNLPYGALLSVKEAKAQGFKDFTIFFPAKDDSEYAEVKRLKEDPIIVAHKKGHGSKMYNIFAWDDGKVYE